MSGSVLDDVKKLLGLSPTDTSFDTDVIIHINSVFAIVSQLGIGSDGGIGIVDNTTTWTNLFGNDSQINEIRSYVFLRVKMLFDPPQTSFAIAAYEKQIQEFEWRLNVRREGQWWTDPNPPAPTYPNPCYWWETI